MNAVFILTGEKESGKTTFLMNWLDVQKNAAGILSPIINEKRCFYDIANKEYYEMEADATSVPSSQLLNVGKYIFSLRQFNKAAETLMYYSSNESLEYFVIDEIGPLELKQHKGFYEALLHILQHLNVNVQLVLVTRLECVDTLKNLLQLFNKKPVIMDVDGLKKELSNEVFGVE